MKRAGFIAICLGAAALLFGCDQRAKELTGPERLVRGLTIVLPGIEGKSYLNRSIRDGLAEGGLPTSIEIRDWTLGKAFVLINQMAAGRARDKGAKLAEDIVAYRQRYPGRPVFIVAHSGGCGVALFAAEAMPAGEGIDTIVLLGASVSPDYDLTGALKRTNSLVSYYSLKDTGFLGVATTIFGTVDGDHTSSAGRVGFALPPAPGAETLAQYRKLKQIEWDQSMSLSGNNGGHTDWVDRRFIRDYVAARLRRQVETLAREGNVFTQPQLVDTPPAGPAAGPTPPLPPTTQPDRAATPVRSRLRSDVGPFDIGPG